MVSCSGFGLPVHAQLLRLFVTLIAHHDTTIADTLAQAQALGAPLMGFPLPRGGDRAGAGGWNIEVVQSALLMIRSDIQPLGGLLAGLAFADLHLMHVKAWREAASLQKETEQLIFPLWNLAHLAQIFLRVSSTRGRSPRL